MKAFIARYGKPWLSIREFIRDSTVYGLSSGVDNVLRFILIPIYVNGLTPEQFGVLGLLEVFLNTSVWLVSGGIHSALVRFAERSEEKAAQYVATGVAVTILCGVGGSLLMFLAAPLIAPIIVGSDEYLLPFRLSLFLLPLMMLRLSGEGVWRIRGRSVFLSLYRVSLTLIEIGVSSVLILQWRLGLTGMLGARSVSYGIATAIALVYFTRTLHLQDIQWRLAKPMWAYSVPLIPHRIALQLNSGAVRYIIQFYLGLTAVGIYTLAYKVSAQVNILLLPVSEAFEAFVYNHAKGPDSKRKIRWASYIFIAWVVAVGIVVYFAVPWLVNYLDKSGEYAGAASIASLLVIAMIFDGFYRVASFGIFLGKKTYVLPFITGTTLFVNVALCLLLIPFFGLEGAAVSVIISLFVKFLASYWQTSKLATWGLWKGFLAGGSIVLTLLLYELLRQ